ncbi:3-deoxy-D-manno-octulosonic acid transferase, partial [Bacteroidales bacterium OttesenSCG-928-A14]|nr:3-deoxy-D-manno-octulosonic acid transferase [Bacteroidales bacterium OttesenSCG-928-A14]
VGGAFETGLHNILEPAVYGVPLFFGPEYDKFNEAVELVALKGAFAIRRFDEMFDKIKDYEKEPDVYRKTCGITKGYVQQNLGSVDKIMNKINK